MSKKVLIPVLILIAGLLIATGGLLGVVISRDHDKKHADTAQVRVAPSSTPTGKGYLGLSVVSAAGGLRVTGVESGGPAAKAGMQTGDTLRSVDSKVVRTPAKLRSAIEAKKPGDNVSLTFDRGDDEKRAQVKLSDAPAGAQVESTPTPTARGSGSGVGGGLAPNRVRLGIAAQAITPDLKQRYSLQQDSGVVVTNVAPNSAAATAGVKPGDVIESLGQTTITTPDDLQQAVSSAPADQPTEIKLKRADQEITASVTIPASGTPNFGGLQGLIPPAALEQIQRALSQGGQSMQALQSSILDAVGGLKFGTVKAISADSLTLQPFGGGDQVSIALTADTTARRLSGQIQPSEIKQDEVVVVASKDGGKTAATVIDLGLAPTAR